MGTASHGKWLRDNAWMRHILKRHRIWHGLRCLHKDTNAAGIRFVLLEKPDARTEQQRLVEIASKIIDHVQLRQSEFSGTIETCELEQGSTRQWIYYVLLIFWRSSLSARQRRSGRIINGGKRIT